MDEGYISLDEAIEQGRKWGAEAPLAPLILSYDVCEPHENIKRNLRQTMQSEYKPFNSLLAPPHDREISIVGFGPSIKDTWKELRGDVWACNGSHDWLIEKGVIPKYAMFWDASEVIGQFAHPHPEVTYLVASRCNRSVFKALEGFNVYVWHANGDAYLDDILCEFKKAEPMLAGGSAAVTRALMVCTAMGYRNINLFGADGSFPEGQYTHAKESIVPEQTLECWVDGKRFYSTSWLAGQVEDFKQLAPSMRNQGCRIEIYGGGLLPFVASLNGFTVHD